MIPENRADVLGLGEVVIFDTTLRDGEQAPGCQLSSSDKLVIARQLASLGVDIIEAGFPAASEGDFSAVERIAAEVGNAHGPVVAALARATQRDIDLAGQALQPAARSRIHVFIATSDLHIERKLGMTRKQVLTQVQVAVRQACRLCPDVQFGCEDASRSDPGFLSEVLTVAIEAGARTLTIADTVGYALPDAYSQLFGAVIGETRGAEQVTWAVHCHDDLGLATANTLAGLRAGARQAEVTVNGLGERAGNASLEEVVMALYVHSPSLGLSTRIDSRQLSRTSEMVSRLTGVQVPLNKAIVGANAFAHEAGIHQDGMLKDQRTYEIMTPESVGAPGSLLVLGKHSGRHAFTVRLAALGVALSDSQAEQAFRRFKDLADSKKSITEDDLRAIAEHV